MILLLDILLKIILNIYSYTFTLLKIFQKNYFEPKISELIEINKYAINFTSINSQNIDKIPLINMISGYEHFNITDKNLFEDFKKDDILMFSCPLLNCDYYKYSKIIHVLLEFYLPNCKICGIRYYESDKMIYFEI